MNFSDFPKSLSSGTSKNLYYFSGDEPYFIRKGKQLIKETFTGGDAEVLVYEGKELSDLSGFLADAKTPSLLSPARIMILEDGDKVKKPDMDALKSYCDSPSGDVAVVFIIPVLDKRKKLHKFLEKNFTFVETSPLAEKDLPRWIKNFLEEKDFTIDRSAGNLLIELIGSNLFRLESELNRIMLAAGDNRKLTLEDLEQTTRSSSHAVFDITDSIGSRDCGEALKILNHMMNDGSNPLYEIMPIMKWKFRQLIVAKSAQLAGSNESDIIKKAKAWYFKDRFIKQMKSFSIDELQRCFRFFNEADIKMKSHPTDNRLLMEKLIIDLCRED